jgi:hypothetical protein
MGIADTVVRTISCDGPGCDKSVMFDRKDEKATFENPDNAWLRTTRVVQSADGRNLVYHNDECEVKGTATGAHNILEAPKIVPGNAAAVALAAQAAAQTQEADKTIRDGQPTKIHVVDK